MKPLATCIFFWGQRYIRARFVEKEGYVSVQVQEGNEWKEITQIQ